LSVGATPCTKHIAIVVSHTAHMFYCRGALQSELQSSPLSLKSVVSDYAIVKMA
jgi:hypothetical protein